MPTISPNVEGISAIIDQLTPDVLAAAPITHFPVQLPLTFPSPVHHLNFLAILHLVNSTYSHPRHAAYLASAGITAYDASLRGVMGAFLASDESWSVDNLLGAAAWAQGKMTEEKVADIFAIEVMREREHETMKGIQVGGRWQPGVDMAGDLVGLFKRLGQAVSAAQGRCVGNAVLRALKEAGEAVHGMKGEKGHEYARVFCDQAVHFEKSLADPYPAPSGKVIPAAPLKLLQDISHLSILSELNISVPKSHDFDNISPLPLPISLLTYAGLVDLSSLHEPHTSTLATSTASSGSGSTGITELLQIIQNGPSGGIQARQLETVSLPLEVLTSLQSASVEVCREIWATARFSSDRDAGAEWKRNMSLLDVYRVGVVLEGYRRAGGLGKELVYQA